MRFLKNIFKKKQIVEDIKPERKVFTTDFTRNDVSLKMRLEGLLENTFKPLSTKNIKAPVGTMDSVKHASDAALQSFKTLNNATGISESVLLWYASQGFIGYQNCALLAQHWLISKACLRPAQDAIRKGYETTANNGEELDSEILNEFREGDLKYNINHHLVEFIQMGRIFGIRIAMFIVDSDDEDYYYKPFNPDGITPGSYKGISQIDPYWMSFMLDDKAAGDPGSEYFYEPTWWQITGKLIHRTHLVIYKTEEVPDILKPTYLYGGIPIPQKIYERVYAAERTANEAPMLAMTKRTDVIKCDVTEALANQVNFEKRMAQFAYNRDNYAVKTIGLEDEYARLDTSLAELDTVIMTQFQLVAAASNTPATKLLETSPKGFNATGEFDEASWHQELEGQQEKVTPLVQRHHLLLMLSEIAPKLGIKPIKTHINWVKLDAMTEEEQALVNKGKAETGKILMEVGAINGEDERKRIINDPDSGYNGLLHEEGFEPDQDYQEELEDA
jgi:phage-related protein (TIGR01555 family)